MAIFRGERVVLRAWRPDDLPPFAALNADPRVMEFMPGTLSREESDALARRCQEGLAARGYGLWAVEVPGVTDFIGYVGLSVPRFEAAFTPCVEVGWRIAHAYWGRGYATEAARVALAVGFARGALAEIVAFTVPANRRPVQSWSDWGWPIIPRRISTTRFCRSATGCGGTSCIG